ncbi:nitronate monooxygenase [Eupransor demetentiae]|uniref:Probable nitronate monooxygenase n=1 Tax=Eupransor demetentiae TaxID=3109584 RepID=A0ABP0EQ77_9LACO|nr:NAD(P)H-dependent flavin oxidoreductase YrpB [Lactobacillaceae bacterium LMG 33000]
MTVKIENPIFDKLGLKYPIVEGGMTWAGTGALAAAVSEAGGLGFIGTGYWHGDDVRKEIKRAKALTDKPFGVNVMLLSRHIREVFDVIIEEGVKVVATGAGDPSPFLDELHAAGIVVMPVVPSASMARMMERKGVDAVIAEGMESGGHIGRMTTMALIPQVVDAVNIPVIAAGGIGDGRGVAAAFMLGASGVQMGTRFLTAAESEIHENFKKKVLKAKDIDTIVTGEITGNRARVLKNKMAKEFVKNEVNEIQKPAPDYETLEKLESGTLKAAVKEGDKDHGAFMAGQISGLINDEKPVKEILADIWEQATDLMGIPNTTK